MSESSEDGRRRESRQTVAAEFAWARDLSLGGLFIALGVVVPIIFHAVGGGHLGRICWSRRWWRSAWG